MNTFYCILSSVINLYVIYGFYKGYFLINQIITIVMVKIASFDENRRTSNEVKISMSLNLFTRQRADFIMNLSIFEKS